jgi:hypothetical protein
MEPFAIYKDKLKGKKKNAHPGEVALPGRAISQIQSNLIAAPTVKVTTFPNSSGYNGVD